MCYLSRYYLRLKFSFMGVGLLLITLPVLANSRESCPNAYLPSAVPEVCQYERSSRTLVYSERRATDCAQGYERVLGLEACIAKKSMVDVVGDRFLIRERNEDFCPQGMQKENTRSLCIASDTRLAVHDRALVRTSSRDRPLLDPDSATLSTLELSCPIGFFRPPGFSCIEDSLVYGSRENNRTLGLVLDPNTCPEEYFIPDGKSFCVPNRSLPTASVGDMKLTIEVPVLPAKLREGGWQKMLRCQLGYQEIWLDPPAYKNSELKDQAPTRICVPKQAQALPR